MTKIAKRKPSPMKQIVFIPGVPGRKEKPAKPKQLILPWPCSTTRLPLI